MQDQKNEGIVRRNLAETHIKLKQFGQARSELLQAINCDESFGYAAEPWKAWDVLYDLELATEQPQAAVVARAQARQSYLAYRRDGEESYEGGKQFCDVVFQALTEGKQDTLAQQMSKLLTTEDHGRVKALLPHLLALLGGARELARADDPALFYQDAVELQLLLEALGGQ